ncbi:MAG: hypothetical protein KIT46_04540 [Anaerolineales bacterium]|nr:hypothetical protein [Anaerolineales bacterium]MCW5855298.1 hypothetical protein [Anaerolineales bacterium]
MPIENKDMTYTQLGLGAEFDALEDDGAPSAQDAADISAAAREALMLLVRGDRRAWAAKDGASLPHELPKWLDSFVWLLGRGWPWRQATFIAWLASPRKNRWPPTQEELATQVLGLSSDRRLSVWRQKNPMIETTVGMLQSAELYHARADVLAALKEVAAEADYKAHPDRKMFLEMTGDYVPISQLKAMLLKGDFKTKRGVEDLSDEELIQLSQGDWGVLAKEGEPNGSDAEPTKHAG